MPTIPTMPQATLEWPVYDFGDILSIPKADRVWMTQGYRLKPDEPKPSLLSEWCTDGRLITVGGTTDYLCLPTLRAPGGRRFTTVHAYQWWTYNLNLFKRSK